MRAIDADALLEELKDSHFPGAPYIDAGISIAIGKVLDAPTIEPERPTGRWEMVSSYGNPPTYFFRCSECGDITFGMHKFCGECGARMEVEHEEKNT